METIALSVEKTMALIEVSEAKEMVARYQATRKTLIDKTFGINDTRSIWFSIDGIRDFIDNLPEYVSGVRIYLATYAQDSEHYPNQTTVVFIGTVEKDGRDVDPITTKALFDIDIDLGILGPFNQGKACPPVCNFSTDSFAEKTMIPIELPTAKKIVAHYNNTRKTLIDETFGINDTRSIWFSIDGIRNFINTLPKYASGVRIYLATYAQDSEHYPNQTTVIFTGTIEKDRREINALTADALFDIDFGILGPFNQGKACPPNCG